MGALSYFSEPAPHYPGIPPFLYLVPSALYALCFRRATPNFYNRLHLTTPPLSFRKAVIKFYFFISTSLALVSANTSSIPKGYTSATSLVSIVTGYSPHF